MQVLIEKLVTHGKGLARFEGKIVFVDGVIEGELVRVEPIKQKKDFIEARLLEVLSPSKDRVEPVCPHYEACGGCDAQYLDHKAQVQAKTAMVIETFSRQAGIALGPATQISSLPWRSRNRMQLHSDGRTHGFKKRSSNEILAVPECQTVAKGLLPFLKAISKVSGRHTILDPDKFTIDGPMARVNLLQRTIYFDPESFFQNNLSCFELALGWLKTELSHYSGDLIELYAGCGVLSAMFCDQFDSVTLVEEDQKNLILARKNIDHNNLDIVDQPSESFVKTTTIARPSHTCLIVDPPRDGLSDQVKDWICREQPKHLVYVSCNPASQARDFKSLKSAGYVISTWALWDFYPQTWHIETCLIATKHD